MSIFDYFVSKPADEQPKKSLSPTPHRRIFSELEEAKAEAKDRYPEDSEMVDAFVRVLKEAYQSRYKKKLGGEPQPMKAEPRFFLSEDRMSAYACLLPPENGGDGISVEGFLEDMHYEGISHGILREDIERELARGYFRIFPVARGTEPQEGIDGKVTELFQRRSNKCLEIRSDNQVDFKDIQLQPIRKGTVICLIRAAKPGTDGMDVTGQKLPSPPPISVSAPQGENTALSKGGQALTASVDGILYIKDDLFCVHAQKIIDGDLNQFQGTLQISGNLYVEGNVDGGVSVVASGDVVINGKVMQARVTSMSGTIRVQHGIYGTSGKTFLSAAGQVQAPVMEWAEINAGDSVIAEVISNSTIRSDSTVYVMAGRGTITGSSIQAGDSVLCLRIGNLAKDRSRFSVGYPPPHARDVEPGEGGAGGGPVHHQHAVDDDYQFAEERHPHHGQGKDRAGPAGGAAGPLHEKTGGADDGAERPGQGAGEEDQGENPVREAVPPSGCPDWQSDGGNRDGGGGLRHPRCGEPASPEMSAERLRLHT